MKILSLDASISSTGYSIIDDNLKILECGKFTTKQKDSESYRIFSISEKCEELISKHDVDLVVVEAQFVSRNKKTGMKLAHLLGAIMYISQKNGLELITIEPSKVRSILVGKGDATKEEIAKYVQYLYKEENKVISLGEYSDKNNKAKTSDIFDSISIAIAYFIGIHNGQNFNTI